MSDQKTGFKHFVLANKKASIFYCPVSGLKVVGAGVSSIPAVKARTSKKVQSAIRAGHIKELTSEEYQKFLIKSEAGESGTESTAITALTKEVAGKMSNDECYTYYIDNYELSDDEKNSFKALSVTKMREFLVNLEAANA